MIMRYWEMTKQMVRETYKDAMLFLCILAPFLAGIVMKLGLPVLERALTKGFHASSILEPYYMIFDLLLALLGSMMFAFISAMVILGEIDEGIAKYIGVTPVGLKGYLLSRLILPLGSSAIFILVFLPFFSQLTYTPILLIGIALYAALLGVITVEIVTALSKNKVEGMAIVKVSSLQMLGLPIPFFIQSWAKIFAYVFPSYWMAECVKEKSFVAGLIGVVIAVVWIEILWKKFYRKFY